MKKRKSYPPRLLALLFGLLSCLAPLDLTAQAGEGTSGKREITIRNLTKEVVEYTLSRLYDQGQPVKHSIRPDGLDRIACSAGLDAKFGRGAQTISYRLDCGLSYSFRYNESDELELYTGSHGLFGVADLAPYVPTPMVVVDQMLELAKAGPSDVLYDLGCGDGRIVITAAKKLGTRGVGIDLDPKRIADSNEGAREAGVENLVEFRLQDVMKADFTRATIVTLYLLPESNALLRPLLESQLNPGVTVVSHNYSIPGWQSRETGYVTIQDEKGQDHTIYVYKK
jgi:hypothetical protein